MGRLPEIVDELDTATELSKRARMLFLVSKGDVSIEVLKRIFGLRSKPQSAQIELVPGLDHAMTGSVMRKMVASRMAEFLAGEPIGRSLYETQDRTMMSPVPNI
jgi:hypothetical protein